jgi:hypothetical protein
MANPVGACVRIQIVVCQLFDCLVQNVHSLLVVVVPTQRVSSDDSGIVHRPAFRKERVFACKFPGVLEMLVCHLGTVLASEAMTGGQLSVERGTSRNFWDIPGSCNCLTGVEQ